MSYSENDNSKQKQAVNGELDEGNGLPNSENRETYDPGENFYKN